MGVKIYYLSTEGNQPVSQNFRVKEFACKDGTDIVPVDMDLVAVLQDVRNHFGAPVTVNSAYRTREHNRKVGGVDGSQHIRGTAADISVKGVTPVTVYAYLDQKYPNTYGIGLYQSFTHIDVRPARTRW